MRYKKIQNEVTELFKNDFKDSNELFDLNNYLKKSYTKAQNDIYTLIPEHVFLLEQATTLMLLFSNYISHASGNNQKNAFNAQISRTLNSLISARELLLNGFEDTARVISRNFIESLEISLAILIDEDFANDFFGDDGIEFNILWKNKIGYGKIYKYIKQALKLANISDNDSNNYIQQHKNIKNTLSSSVHADEAGAFFSMLVPILGYPDMYSLTKHGVISYHTPNHINMLIHEIHSFFGIFINCFINNKIKFLNDISKDNPDLKAFFDYAILFQDILTKYDLPDGNDIVAEDYSKKVN